MKRHTLLAILACSFGAASLAAQTTPPPTAGTQKPAGPAVRKQVLPSPASIRPKPAARPSTAEAGPAHAGWKPLNELPAVALVDRNGKPTTLPTAATGSRHWFLLYRTANCIPCDRLMLALQSGGSAELKAGKPYVIAVDSADASALERVHAAFTGLADATWAADRQKGIATTLKLHGAPVLLAMEGSRVAWRVAGSLDSTDTVVRLSNSWLQRNATQANQAPALSWTQASKAAAATQAAADARPATGATAPKQ